MENVKEDGAAEGRGVLLNKHYVPVSERAGKLIERFRATKLRHHRDLELDLAEAAEVQKSFLEQPFEYKKYIDKYYTHFSNKKPRGRETSHDLMNCSYQALTGEDRRKAGTYARVVDYMIAEKVTNFKAFLAEHKYTGVLELARQEKRPARQKEKRPFIKVYLDGSVENLMMILKDCPREVGFTLFCDAGPGRNTKVTATATPVIKFDDLPFTKAENDWLNSRLARMRKIEQTLLKQVSTRARGSAQTPAKRRKPKPFQA